MQRFWQYAFEFIDYNNNTNNDTGICAAIPFNKPWMQLWDEDCDWNIRWDDDDENLGSWPTALASNSTRELYLIRRLLLRLNYSKDPDAPVWSTCNSDWSWWWCLWNIEMLKLDWKDYWVAHNWTSSWAFDWIIDTWQCDKSYSCTWIPTNNWFWNDWIMPTTWVSSNWWVPLFPEYINVKNVNFNIYPIKDYKLAWKENDLSMTINPYVKLNINLWLSWWKRRYLSNKDPQINISTTINLSYN